MSFHSILFDSPEDRPEDNVPEPPAFFVDLNCDQLVEEITADNEYDLKPFFYACVSAFSQKMREMREHLIQAQKRHDKENKQAWFLDAVAIYCDAINSLAEDLSQASLRSRGFSGFREYLTIYAGSARFTSLLSETKQLEADLATVRYCVLIKGDTFTVRKYDSEADYSVEVEQTFQKFKQADVNDYRMKLSTGQDMNQIEAKILEFVAKLHPEVFQSLDKYCAHNNNYLDDIVVAFDREIQFYLAYLRYIAGLKEAGLEFCYPRISAECKEIYDYGGFDIALAKKLVGQRSSVVCNDFHLKGQERVLVVSGPNQGGKTTFARAFGQLHYLASIGCPVPGNEAHLFLFDKLFTHFEKEEKVENFRGKLEDDLVRIHSILDRTSPRSIIILNEIFTSTTIQDEAFLSEKVMEKILSMDLLCVWVTFVDKLASFGPQTVSMVSTVVPDNPALRTFKIVRRPADGLAYAMAIAQKYRLTYDSIKERIGP
jgi:DNA mismatch repair protein MutS